MTRKTVYGLILPAVIGLLVYWPAMVTEFGMHNDYGLLPGNFKDHGVFLEAPDLYIVGRALQALLVIGQGWCIAHVRDFALWRTGAFLMMLGFAFLLIRFLERRLGLERFWSRVLALSVMMLPASTVFVLFMTNFWAGYFTLLLALSSYLLLDPAWPVKTAGFFFLGKPRPVPLVFSMLLFLAALFVYPPNAMVVFAGSFAVLFLSPAREAVAARLTVVRDVVFYGLGMGLYFLINIFFIVPNRPAWVGDFSITSPVYTFSLASNLVAKLPLAADTFWTAMGGTWHSVLGPAGGVITALIIAGSTAALYLRRSSPPAGEKKSGPVLSAGALAAAVLFVMANLPALMAKECHTLIGYRVLLPTAVLILIWQWGLVRRCALRFSGSKTERVLKGMAAVLVALSCLLAYKNVADASRNYNRELNFIRRNVLASDPDRTGHFLVVMLPSNRGISLIGRTMPYEFGYMITQDFMAQYMIDDILKTRGRAPLSVEVDVGDVIFTDPYTRVIDLNEAAPDGTAMAGKTVARVTTSAAPLKRVDVLRHMGVYFTFREKRGGKEAPFWQIDADARTPPWIQIDFGGRAQVLRVFTFGVYDPGGGAAAPLTCRLQVSNGGNAWTDLPVGRALSKPDDPYLRFYRVMTPGPFKKYRFTLTGAGGAHLTKIASIHMLLKL